MFEVVLEILFFGILSKELMSTQGLADQSEGAGWAGGVRLVVPYHRGGASAICEALRYQASVEGGTVE